MWLRTKEKKKKTSTADSKYNEACFVSLTIDIYSIWFHRNRFNDNSTVSQSVVVVVVTVPFHAHLTLPPAQHHILYALAQK